MYNVSSTFLTKVAEPSRYIKAKVQIGAVTIDESIIQSFEVENSMGGDKMPTIGGSIAGKLKLSMLLDPSIPSILINTPITPYITVDTGLVDKWIPLGKFYANTGDITRNKQTIDIECFDIMPDMDTYDYITDLEFPKTVSEMRDDIATRYGVQFAVQTLPSVSFNEKPTGTVRQVLTYMASLISTNILVNRDGKFEFRFINTIAPATFTFDGNNYIDFSLTSDSLVTISQLKVKTGDTEMASGNDTGIAISFENPEINDVEELDVVFNRVYPLSFYAFKLSMQGMPHFDTGDVYTFTDVGGINRQIIITSHVLRYAGGLRSEIECNSPKEDTKEVTVTGGSTVEQAIKNNNISIQKAIQNATSLITGNKGGNVVIISDDNGLPIEIVITDNVDLNSAMNIWRWNAGGLGHSTTGYNGVYETAITADGKIVADFIGAGTLNANLIKTGRITSFKGNSWIDIDTGMFYFGDANGLTMSSTDGLMLDGVSLSDLLSSKLDSSWEGEFNNYIGFSKATGLVIGDAESKNKIQITGGAINFYDENGNLVAYVINSTLWITNAEIKDTFVINKHQFKRYNDDVTIVTWIG